MLTDLAYLGLVLSTQMLAHTCLELQFQRLMPMSNVHGLLHVCNTMHTLRHIHTHEANKYVLKAVQSVIHYSFLFGYTLHTEP